MGKILVMLFAMAIYMAVPLAFMISTGSVLWLLIFAATWGMTLPAVVFIFTQKIENKYLRLIACVIPAQAIVIILSYVAYLQYVVKVIGQ